MFDRLASLKIFPPLFVGFLYCTETHTLRQATQHVCLPSLLGDGDKGIEIAYAEEKNIFFRARKFKLLRSQGIDSQESITSVYVTQD